MAITSLSASSLKEILFNLNMQFKNKGISTGNNLLKQFMESDTDKSGYLEREEFENLLNKSGIFLSRMDVTYLMRYFDKNKDGKISFNEFYESLVPELNQRRANLVERVWQSLLSASNPVTIQTLYSNFNASNHPLVVTGEKHEQEILNRFLDLFDANRKGPEGLVTPQEFLRGHKEMSASYPIDDDSFARMIECVWGVSEEKSLNNSDISELESLIKEKIRLKMISTDTEEKALTRLFKFVDLNSNGSVSLDEFKQAMGRLGLQLKDEQICAVFDKYDSDHSGCLQYEEFAKAIGNNKSYLFKKSTSHTFYQ